MQSRNNYTSSVIPITQDLYIIFLEVSGKETFYLGEECYSDSKGGRKSNCAFGKHIFITMY